jgi:hypothetical protein
MLYAALLILIPAPMPIRYIALTGIGGAAGPLMTTWSTATQAPGRCRAVVRPGAGDGPLSVRVRPSSLKRDRDRRTTTTGEKCLVKVHAKSRLTPEPLRTLRSEDKGQAGACPDRTRAILCKVRAVTIQQPSTATTPDSNKHELSPTPSVNWDSGQPPSGAAVRDQEADRVMTDRDQLKITFDSGGTVVPTSTA